MIKQFYPLFMTPITLVWAALLSLPLALNSARANDDAFLEPLLSNQQISEIVVSALQGEISTADFSESIQVSATTELAREIWRGNRPQLLAAVDGIWIEFTKAAAEESKDELDPLRVNIRFERDGLSIVSNYAVTPRYRAGVRFSDSRNREKVFYLEGYQDSGLALVVPQPEIVANGRNRTALICPVVKTPFFPPQALRISEQSAWRPSRVAAEAAVGLAAGEQIAGINEGKSIAQIAISKSLPPAEIMRIEKEGKDPAVRVEYRHNRALGEHLQPWQPPGVVEGLEASVKLLNPAQYVRKMSMREQIWIQTVPFDYWFGVSARGELTAVTTRNCLLVYRARQSQDRFWREAMEDRIP